LISPFEELIAKMEAVRILLEPIVGITNKMDDLIAVCEQIRDFQSDQQGPSWPKSIN